jgi:hypothetical protein
MSLGSKLAMVVVALSYLELELELEQRVVDQLADSAAALALEGGCSRS